MWTTTYKLRDVDDVIAEIKHYQEKYDITAFQLYDLTAIVKKSWTVEFCQKLLAEGINLKWSLPSGTRSEALDKETLEYLRRTGCNYLCYAPESGSPETLKRIKKKVNLPRMTESILEARRQGIILRANFIVGFPEESRRDVFKTFKYALMLAIRGVDEVSMNVFSPYPGSELFDDMVRAGRVKLDDSYFLRLISNYTDYTKTDLITFNVAVAMFGPAGELGPLGLLYRVGGFWAVALVKLGAIGIVIAVLARYPWQRLRTRRWLALIVGAIGIIGAWTNALAFVWV